MKYNCCPIVSRGGILVSRAILKARILNSRDKFILAYIENCDDGCSVSNEYLAELLDCSETQVSNAIHILSFLKFVVVRDGKMYVNPHSEAWDK